jgi:hypothetical protein
VSVQILLGGEVRSFTGATVYVRLEDVSYADAPASLIAEDIIQNVSHTAGNDEKLYSSLYGQIPNQQSRYSVRVHLDLDGDYQVSYGDYISMESYPVLTYGYPNEILVRVQEVQ